MDTILGKIREAMRLLAAAPAPIDFGDQPLTVKDIDAMFFPIVREMWGEKTAAALKFEPTTVEEMRKNGPVAALIYQPPVRAIGSSLVQRAKYYRLVVSPRLLTKPREFVRQILVHEAAHIGYPKHNDDFFRLVRKHKGAVSESDARGEGIRVQRKEGARYKTIKTFGSDQMREARKWAQEAHAQDKGKYRVIF